MKKMTITEKIKKDLKKEESTYLPINEAKNFVTGTMLKNQNKKLTYKGKKRYDYMRIFHLPMLVEINFNKPLVLNKGKYEYTTDKATFGGIAECMRYQPETKMSTDTGIKKVATKDWFEFHKFVPGLFNPTKSSPEDKKFQINSIKKVFSDCKIKETSNYLTFIREINTIEELFETYEQAVKLYGK